MSLNESVEGESCGFAKTIAEFLNSGNYDDAICFVNSENYLHNIEKQTSEIIIYVAKHLNERNYNTKQELFNCCEDIIYQIAELGDPDEVLLEFIEHAEKNEDVLFSVMLKAMKITLLRMGNRQGFHLIWCFSTIIRHINHMEHSEDFSLEGEEYVLLDNCDASRKCVDIYSDILDFCRPLCDEITNWSASRHLDLEEKKSLFVMFLLKLLGRPLVYLNLEEKKQKGDIRLIAEGIFYEIIKFKIDLMYFINCVTRYDPHKKEACVESTDVEYSNLSFAVFYYLIFKEKLFLMQISHVYNPLFVFEMLTNLAVELLNIEHSGVQYKGLCLFQAALERIADFSLAFTHPQDNLYGEVCESLCKIMIYSEVNENRILSVGIFKSFILKFNSQGRFIILLNIQNKIKSPNFIGYIIIIAKDLIMKALNEKSPSDLKYFTGQNLRNLIMKFCYLDKGAESNLIELSDQIISSLNLLRFLFIRDKQNHSGIVELIPFFEKSFFEPIKIGISLSVAHYKLQRNEIETAHPDEKVNVSIAGTPLNPLTKIQKLEIIDTALCTFDLLESLRVRTEECVEEYKQSHLIELIPNQS